MNIDFNPVNATVTIAGQEVNPINLVLRQEYAEHHSFELTLDYDMYADKFMNNPLKHIELIGRLVVIRLNYRQANNSDSYRFRGVITSIKQTGKEGKKGYLIISGASPTIMLEKGRRTDIYSDKTLYKVSKMIAQRAYSDYVDFKTDPVYNNKIDFLMQYNENDWDFLKRIAYLYRENLYYNGLELLFGYHPDSKSVDLTYDQEIIDLELCSQMISNSHQRFQYVPQNDNFIERDSPDKIENSTSYLDRAEELSRFSMTGEEKSKSYLDVPLYGNSEIGEILKRDKVRTATQSIKIKGRSKTHKTAVGQIININMPADLADTSNIGSYRVIKSVHRIDEKNRYSCEFEAIPASLEVTPIAEPKVVVADSVVGFIRSNTDPLNQGRVQVSFDFSTTSSFAWLRVLTPNAGLSDDKSKNRGMVFIPEVGDQVMLGFEYGDPNRPYVMGSIFHGKNGQGGGANNAEKSIVTRSGIQIVFNDESKSLHIQDPSGNTWDMDGKGNIEVYAPKKIKMNATDIEVSASNNIQFNVGNNLLMRISNKFNATAARMKSIVSDTLEIFSTRSLFSSREKMQMQSDEINTLGINKLFLHSDQLIHANSKGIMDLKSSGNMNLAQDAVDRSLNPTESIALAMVEFRVNNSYEGEYGFDWWRTGDNGENSYNESLESVFINNHSDSVSGNEALFLLQKQEYKTCIDIRKNPSGNIKESQYIVPRLNLYTKKVSEATIADPKPPYQATLNILVTIDTKLEKLVFEYNKDLFQLSQDSITETLPCAKKLWEEITITCHTMTDGFDSEQEIKVYAYADENKNKPVAEKEDLRSLAGKLIVSKNSFEYRHTEKVVIIPIDTKIMDENHFGLGSIDDESIIRKVLNQAFIQAEIEDYPSYLELASDKEFKIYRELDDPYRERYGKFIFNPQRDDPQGNFTGLSLDGGIYSDQPEFFNYLQQKFLTDKPENERYRGYIMVFIFNEDNYYTYTDKNDIEYKTGGQSPIGSRITALFLGKKDATAAHEILHSLGLYHIYKEKPQVDLHKKYLFIKKKTENIMDEESVMGQSKFSTYRWQWQIINKKYK